MKELQVFNFENQNVRTVEQNGEPYFVLTDVCKVLELSTPAKVTNRLDEDEKGVTSIHTPGGRQNVTIINESGLYAVILRSDKPQAKKFRKWVTSEVLPKIRRTGEYKQGGGVFATIQRANARSAPPKRPHSYCTASLQGCKRLSRNDL